MWYLEIPLTFQDGDVVTFEGAADQKPDHAPGDIHFIIKSVPHGMFARRGDNLYMKHAIALVDALNGFSQTFKHLDDEVVTLRRTGVTPPGYVQLMDDLGMPLRDSPMKRGKLFVEYSIVFPTSKQFSAIDRAKISELFGNGMAASRSVDNETEPTGMPRDEL